MEFLLIFIAIASLIVIYFCAGMLIKFLFGWLPLLIGLAVALILILIGGWIGAGIAVVIIIISLMSTDHWHGTPFFLTTEEKIEEFFHLKD